MGNSRKWQGKSSFFMKLLRISANFRGQWEVGFAFLISRLMASFCDDKKIENCSIELFTIENLEGWCDFFSVFFK
jgi:hypothetical protein